MWTVWGEGGNLLPWSQQFVAGRFGGGLITAALTCFFGRLDGWTERWIESKHKPDCGKFVLSSGKFYGDQEKDKGKNLGVGAQIQEDRVWVSLGVGQVEEAGTGLYFTSLGFPGGLVLSPVLTIVSR